MALPPVHTARGAALAVDLDPTDASPGAPSTREARLSLRALAACFDGAPVDHATHLALVFTLHPSGSVADVALVWPSGLDPKPRACVETTLRQAAFPCPSGAEAKVYADLRLLLDAK